MDGCGIAGFLRLYVFLLTIVFLLVVERLGEDLVTVRRLADER